MNYNPYFSEKDWTFKEAELARNLLRWQRIKEAKQGRAEYKARLKQAKTDHCLDETKPVKKVGKEKLGWN